MGRRLPAVFLIFLFAVPFALADRLWTEVRSPHFTVLTDAGERTGRDVALRFEQMRSAFGTMFHRSKVNLPVPLTIVAFRSQGEILPYAPLWKGKPVELAGFFQGADDQNFIALEMEAKDPYVVVFHEYAHLLLHGNFPVMPVWFDEGFAEYFATLKVLGKEIEYGGMPESKLQALRNNRWLPILDLFAVQHDSAIYNERDKSNIFYAQSCLVVQYLMANDKLEQAFQYLQLAQIEKRPIAEAIKTAFGMDAASLEKAVREYLNAPARPNRAAAPDVEDGPYRSRKIDDLTAQATLADIHAHSDDYQEQAVQEFDAILRQQPGNFAANRGLGYLYLRQNQFDKAADYFRKAMLTDAKDANLHYLTALLMNRQALKEGTQPDNPALMRQELLTAVDLDPTIADAYNLLAFSYAMEGRYEPAITAQKKAIELNPSYELYQNNLARIYLQAQRWDDAEAILVRLQQSTDPQVRDNAKQNLAAMQTNRQVAAQVSRSRELKDNITDPRWQRKDTKDTSPAESAETEYKPDTRKTLYMYGRLQSVDCSGDPVAIVNVQKGQKLMKLRTENYKKLLVMGADEFSCGWRDRKVLVNYKPGGKADGDIVTLELDAGK